MITKVQYTDATDRQIKMDANKNKFLIMEENIADGNFLTFTDIKPIDNQVTDLQSNFDIMYAQMLMLQGVTVSV